MLKRLHSAGHEPEEIATRLARYLAKTETRYVSLARFAKTFDDWKEFRFLEGPPVVDGWMSPELERLTRPAGVYAA